MFRPPPPGTIIPPGMYLARSIGLPGPNGTLASTWLATHAMKAVQYSSSSCKSQQIRYKAYPANTRSIDSQSCSRRETDLPLPPPPRKSSNQKPVKYSPIPPRKRSPCSTARRRRRRRADRPGGARRRRRSGKEEGIEGEGRKDGDEGWMGRRLEGAGVLNAGGSYCGGRAAAS